VYRVLDLYEKAAWQEYLGRLPESQRDIYFTPEYYEIYQNNSDGRAFCFVFESDDKVALYPFLQKQDK